MKQKPEEMCEHCADWSKQMIAAYGPMVEAAGLLTNDMDGSDVHRIAGKLMSDALLHQRGLAVNPHGILPADMTLTSVSGLSEHERAQLRKRISEKQS